MINDKVSRKYYHPYSRLVKDSSLTSSPSLGSVIPKLLIGTSIKILIIDDNIIYHQILTRVLIQQFQLLPSQIISVLDPIQALHQLSLIPFTLIFMDIDLPLLNGMQITSIIRQFKSISEFPNINNNLMNTLTIHPKNIQIPIIAITTNLNQSKQYFKAGMNEFLPKPINFQQLNQILHKLSL